ncbi:glycosyltransferase family 2 protein [Actinokineospora terrae]|uniref:Glycosyltransferase, GT2 family n=1 Tax=Actinokineospora terrae TaxID=155974 RepID=A0A1H9XHU7_9PSEU|nr:glycosyltransferase family 2 protein [Actinokineospora terrae]SES45233.1 Glycosyltransferase, GT2 family [Actinokineospora terrae]
MLTDAYVPHNRWDLLDLRTPAAPTVSVVVAHYEQHDQLARVLAALRNQTAPPLEVIVADDGSAVVPVCPGASVLTQPNRGFRAAAARNRGAAAARGEVLVFLDADTVPGPGFLAAITRRVARCPDVLAVGRREHADLSALRPGDDPATAPALTAPTWLDEGYRATADLLHADGRSFRYVISAVLAYRASLHIDLGGFDERFTDYGGEDWDLAYRAWNNGAVLVHEADAVAWHDGPSWEGRGTEGDLDAQTARLAALIPEPTTRGAPLPAALPDVLVDVAPGADVIRTTHSVLRQDFRDLRVRLPHAHPLYAGTADDTPWSWDQRLRARAHLTVDHPLPPTALTTAMSTLITNDLAEVAITTGGRYAGVLRSTRALGRARRWVGRLSEDEAACGFGGTGVEVGAGPAPQDTLEGYFQRR